MQPMSVMDFVVRDSQIHNSVLATVSVALCVFGEDAEIQRIARVIEEFDADHEETSGKVAIEIPAPVESTRQSADDPIDQSNIVSPRKSREDDSHSPRSSCPSLDF